MDLLALAAALMMLALAACGEGAAATGSSEPAAGGAASEPAYAVSGGVASICAAGATECNDTILQFASDEPVPIEGEAIEQFRRDARYYLGRGRDEIPDVVRIARVNDRHFPVTDDYRVGRITVELDDVKGPIVTSVTVELPDGPETFKLTDQG